MSEILKIIRNKSNNQLMISLSRKKLNLRKDDTPISIEIEKVKLNFLKKKEGLL